MKDIATLLTLKQPCVMGILNLTEDSFFDGGKYVSDEAVILRAKQIINEGGEIIDLGAVSTRPGAQDIPEETENEKIVHAVQIIRQQFPNVIISIDTWRAKVAENAVLAGANIINDISGGTFDPQMANIIGKLKVPYILMHTTAKPNQMQQLTMGEKPLAEMLHFFGNQIDIFKKAGCKDIILDPGFGFGKTIEQNYFLLENLQALQIFELPILVGISRKSMIYNLLKTNPDNALNGTTVLNTVALRKGASILRVHDVKEAVETVKLCQKLAFSTVYDTTASHQ